ncbi:MAG TPA: response regulator [Vicinamibacteria bacterium]|nr:response regulator [Vicinamibacteria bacterium]
MRANGPESARGGPEPLVLVVEDEAQMMRFLRATLPAQGYRVVEAATGQQALVEASTRRPDLVLLDLGLPDLDGVEVTRRLREWSAAPIIVLSARGRENDKIEALDAGADDYLTKPFGTGELLARMRVAWRNAARAASPGPEPVFEAAGLRVDLGLRRVFVEGREVRLTRTQYRLLATLVKHAGKVVTHRQLLREVWGPGAVDQSHYVRVYMAQLRHKLESDPARPRLLLTETGVGYRLRAD